MKVLISADLEGASGVASLDETMLEGKDYDIARRQITLDVNAAIEGALEAGATEILVNDAHSVMRNILVDELHPEAILVRGWPRPLSQMEGIDESFDAVFFIGYHARKGSARAHLDHTIDSRIIDNVQVNGMPVGEIGINAMIAGYYNVPVVLVSGSRAAVQEALMLLKKVETVIVKEDVSRYAVKCIHPTKTRKAIRAKARYALENIKSYRPFKLEKPVTLEVRLIDTGMADIAETIPGIERTAPRELKYVAKDEIEAFKILRIIISLAREIIHHKL